MVFHQKIWSQVPLLEKYLALLLSSSPFFTSSESLGRLSRYSKANMFLRSRFISNTNEYYDQQQYDGQWKNLLLLTASHQCPARHIIIKGHDNEKLFPEDQKIYWIPQQTSFTRVKSACQARRVQ